MNQESKISALQALHAPECVQQQMVYIVFEDGEVCLTKGAELFMHRSLHTVYQGNEQAALPASVMPVFFGEDHGYLVARGALEALAASALIAGPKSHAQFVLDDASRHPGALGMLLH